MGMLNMRKPILSLVGLLAVASLVGCQQESGKKGDSKELSQEQIIDKGLQAFEHLKDGDTILIAEGCTHHRQCEDIGRENLVNQQVMGIHTQYILRLLKVLLN